MQFIFAFRFGRFIFMFIFIFIFTFIFIFIIIHHQPQFEFRRFIPQQRNALDSDSWLRHVLACWGWMQIVSPEDVPIRKRSEGGKDIEYVLLGGGFKTKSVHLWLIFLQMPPSLGSSGRDVVKCGKWLNIKGCGFNYVVYFHQGKFGGKTFIYLTSVLKDGLKSILFRLENNKKVLEECYVPKYSTKENG